MRMSIAVVALLAGLVPATGWAQLKNVYLNDVRINDVQGLRDLKLEKVTVRFDEKGDLHIDAQGYKIDLVDPAGGQAAARAGQEAEGPPRLTRKYFLVTEQTAPGMTEFDIDVYVNSKWIRKLRNNEEQIYTEITKHLQPGKNTVTMVAKKLEGKARRSVSPQHVFRVIVGEGNVGGEHVMIDRPVVDFRRTAADAEDVSREFTFTTR
jgi:hypothetical protein